MRHDVIRDKAVPALLYAPAPHGTSTRNVLTFVNTTAIAGCQDQRKKAEFWRYAIAVVFTNVRTLRVLLCARRMG